MGERITIATKRNPYGGDPVPADPDACYLDSENSILCAACALESDSDDEVPQFRPVATAEPTPGETCDHCSTELRPMADDEGDNADD